jgi:hypothetical protein
VKARQKHVKTNEGRLSASEIKFMRTTAGYPLLALRRNYDILLEELKMRSPYARRIATQTADKKKRREQNSKSGCNLQA